MTSQHPNYGVSSNSNKQPPAMGPKLQVQGSLSKESITIHFSALGKEEEEEEEELNCTTVTSNSSVLNDSNVVTAIEASEEMFEGGSLQPSPSSGVTPASSRLSPSSKHRSPPSQTRSTYSFDKTSSNSSPTKSLSYPSIEKPVLSLLKNPSSDTDPRDGASSTSLRHRQLMKNLVKSLSSDTSQESSSSSSSYRLPESRLNLQLFKQFAQSRLPAAAAASLASDSKTAPSSPLTSPDSRSFFKVSEVEARIEDTKRRLSEAISEPLQLFSKMMDERSSNLVGSSLYRPKVLSSSATELTTINSQLENNNNYSIKEEDGSESPSSWTSVTPDDSSANTKSPNKSFSVALDKCTMSALAKQEDEDFCILSNEDFELSPIAEALDRTDKTRTGFTLLLYGCFVLPLPSYIGGMLLGIGLGFYFALGVVWLTGPKRSEGRQGHSSQQGRPSNATKLEIKEPEIYKGWMNEIFNYDPETYHATLTHSVYVRVEGSTIRLSKPNHNIARRAAHNDSKPDVTFVSQKIYDLANSKVYLVPPGLARKRVWNKKYPICIELSRQDDFISKAEGDRSEPSDGVGTSETGEANHGASSPSSKDLTLFLFGRTGRDKEEWFQRFLSASNPKVDTRKASRVGNAWSSHSRNGSRSSLDELLAAQPRLKDSAGSSTTSSAKSKPPLDYNVYMGCLLPKQPAVGASASCPALQSLQSSPGAEKKPHSTTAAQVQPKGEDEEEEETVAWVNAAMGRVFWDFLTEPYWSKVVSKKIQMKLSKIRLPYFMNELTLTELDMGSATPRIHAASAPYCDYRGLWFDLEVSYSGSFLMTLETKMILNRLGKEGENLRLGEFGKDGNRPRTYCLAYSDEESSSAGSSDEEDSSELSNDSAGAEGFVGGHKASKILRFVDKITKSKYFQKATETEFIKKKMEEVSNTPLLLTVEVQHLQGTLAVNIPPPPTDRIWYGFKTPPRLELKARPKLGEREVTLAHVTDWIEKKLYQEFQKILVMPNMDDVWLTIMHSAMDPRTAGGPLVGPSTDPPLS
uniref:SMP-LTD domain-containing protein n=1 Tax=Oryzias latipes TaxID=8090 RepID=A0A3B3HBR1_ORYLA